MGEEDKDFFNQLCWSVLASFLDPQPDSEVLDIACGNGLTQTNLLGSGGKFSEPPLALIVRLRL